jgi:hypothetical protein
MKNAEKQSVYFLIVTIGFALSYFNMKYWADSVATHTNYLISLGILPSGVGLFIGYLFAVFLEKTIYIDLRKNWKILAIGGAAPLIPVVYVIAILS